MEPVLHWWWAGFGRKLREDVQDLISLFNFCTVVLVGYLQISEP